MPLATLIEALHARVPQMHELTRAWVEQNSHSKNVPGVNACGRAIAEAFRIEGLALRVEPGGADSGDHLFWSTNAAASRPAILIIGHHDTVFPPGHFEGYRVADGRGHGPGCFDMKGGLALVWGVVSTLAEAGLLAEFPLVIASVADEEVGSLDSAPYLEALAKNASCALVFESGRAADRIVTRRRGVGNVRARATGRAAHAGNAHADGANAIWSLSRFIDAAQGLTDYTSGLTVNVGLVTGGTSFNTVPERAEASIDLRFETVAAAHALLESLRQCAERSALPGTRIELEGGVKRLPMEKTAASEALYREYAACQHAAGLGSEEQPLVGGGSDANTVSGVGLPVIDGLGPRGGGFHTLEEYVELDSFGPKAEALLRFLCARAGVH
ncbi:MAG TPA: M20 family metallopeptidase [Polyangiaceae bacterium]|nr:M20 family metallopeptidase [Polyangiaceae bacterium]